MLRMLRLDKVCNRKRLLMMLLAPPLGLLSVNPAPAPCFPHSQKVQCYSVHAGCPCCGCHVHYAASTADPAAQGVTHFRDIRYTAGLTYGEMLLQNEYEMSCYNLDHADVAAQRQLFTLFQQARPRSLLLAVCVGTSAVLSASAGLDYAQAVSLRLQALAVPLSSAAKSFWVRAACCVCTCYVLICLTCMICSHAPLTGMLVYLKPGIHHALSAADSAQV